MNGLRVGFCRINIDPPLGAFVAGYFIDRFTEGVLDNIEANAVAIEVNGQRAVLVTADLCEVATPISRYLVKGISEATGLPEECIFFSVSHTHTAPDVCLRSELVPEKNVIAELMISTDESRKVNEDYTENILAHRLAEAAVGAIADLKPAVMGWRTDTAPGITFVRRYLMKDGSVRTNPGIGNPDVVAPVGAVDERVSIVRFDREGADSVLLVNYGNHADSVGGCLISADWPGVMRRTVESAIDGVKCAFLNGAEGDIGHMNPFPKEGDMNGLTVDFDDVTRGYEHTKHMGRVVAAAVLRMYDKVKWVDCDRLTVGRRVMAAISNMPTPEQIPEAERISELHNSGRDSELPYEGMMLTTVVAEAARMMALRDGPDHFDLTLSALVIGPVALLGIPGEPFTGVGVELKRCTDFELVLPLALTNGADGYFPMMSSYDEGGYESRSSMYKAGIAEQIIEEGRALLSDLGN